MSLNSIAGPKVLQRLDSRHAFIFWSHRSLGPVTNASLINKDITRTKDARKGIYVPTDGIIKNATDVLCYADGQNNKT